MKILKQTRRRLITKQNLLSVKADFTWFWGHRWFVETPFGNFEWSDPEYGGDDTMTLFMGNYRRYCYEQLGGYGRSKGVRPIQVMCGDDFTVIIPPKLTRREWRRIRTITPRQVIREHYLAKRVRHAMKAGH